MKEIKIINNALSKLSKIELKKVAIHRSQTACTMHNPIEVYASLRKMAEFASEGMKSIREQVTDEYDKYPEKQVSIKDVVCSIVSGGTVLNYDEDPIYKQIKNDLNDRKKLLDVAQTKQIFDGEGIEVPKVTNTPRPIVTGKQRL